MGINSKLLDARTFQGLKDIGWTVTQIEQMTPEEVFIEFCRRHGITWGNELLKVLNNAQEAAKS